MQDNHSSKKSSVTLEQLLHLKRAERPDERFWDEFDRELHRRQLATAVNVRPWYTRFSGAGLVALRRSAPFGAAAAALLAGFVLFDQHETDATDAPTAPAQIAQASPENVLVVLPAEQFTARARPITTEESPVSIRVPSELTQAQFVVHQFELPPAPARPWKTVASPNMLTVSAIDRGEGFESAGWATGPALRAPANPGAGSF